MSDAVVDTLGANDITDRAGSGPANFPQGISAGTSGAGRQPFYEIIPLTGDTSSTGVLGDFTKTLVAGRTYRFSLAIRTSIDNSAISVSLEDGGSGFMTIREDSNAPGAEDNTNYQSIIRTMLNNGFTVNVTTNGGTIFGNGSTTETYLIIEELPFHVATTF